MDQWSVDYQVLCFLLVVGGSKYSDQTFTLEVSWHFQVTVSQKPLWMLQGVFVGIIFYPLEYVCLTKASDALATSYSPRPINMMSLIEWTNMLFCRTSRWFRLYRLCYDAEWELIWPWDETVNAWCYLLYMNAKYSWLSLRMTKKNALIRSVSI